MTARKRSHGATSTSVDQPRAHVAVIFTGGTISMRPHPTTGGKSPVLTGADLLKQLPDVRGVADLDVVEWGLMPGSHLNWDHVIDIARILKLHLDRPAIDGAVVVQGTDTIEETAFAWDLMSLSDKPIVVVGSMRSASEEGYDGPKNLRDAIRAAADPQLAGQGAAVVMAGVVHAADAVRKHHSHSDDAFQSYNSEPLGTIYGGRVSIRRRGARVRLPGLPNRTSRVAFVKAMLGGDAPRIPDDAEGVVIEAMGVGNTPHDLLQRAREAIVRGAVVVLTTRCPVGGVRRGYGYPGGSDEWWNSGAVFSGWLDPLKARIALALALGVGLRREEIGRLFVPYGGGAL